MKKLWLLLLCAGLLNTTQAAFRDISPNSQLNPALKYLVEKDALKDQGFFRPNQAVPAVMFWDVLLKSGDFNPKTQADFDTLLPANIQTNHPSAKTLQEAIRRGFIEAGQDFEPYQAITRGQGLEAILKAKGIRTPRLASKDFTKKIKGVSPLSKYVPVAETAYRAGLLNDQDIANLNSGQSLKRHDFVRWLYQWHQNGELRPTLPEDLPLEYPYEKRIQKNKKSVQIGISSKDITPSQTSLDLKVLQAVLKEIEARYKFADQLTQKRQSQMVNKAIGALVSGLDDKYSNYVQPEDSDQFFENLQGQFEGIGAYVEMLEDQFTITSPIKGSPAEKAGLEPGDVVTHVDGEDIAGQDIKTIIHKVRGPAHTPVKLTIKRSNNANKDYTVIRGEITIPSLTIEFEKDVAVVGLHQFSRNTGSKLKTLLETEVLPQNPRGIIFDLRNNPGGFLTAAVEVGSLFLETDEVIFHTEYRQQEKVYKARTNGLLTNYKRPLVFLQNKGSASASEILTAMVKDHEIGVIVGTNSVGKGTVQEVLSYTNGGTLKLTVAKWLTPNQRWIHETGVIPDIVVSSPTAEEKKLEVDRQLDTAINKVMGR